MRGVRTTDDCEKLQSDLQSVYGWAEEVNMQFNSTKFEWVRYSVGKESAPDFAYLAPDSSAIECKENLRDLGVMLSSNLSFTLQVAVQQATPSRLLQPALVTYQSGVN